MLYLGREALMFHQNFQDTLREVAWDPANLHLPGPFLYTGIYAPPPGATPGGGSPPRWGNGDHRRSPTQGRSQGGNACIIYAA